MSRDPATNVSGRERRAGMLIRIGACASAAGIALAAAGDDNVARWLTLCGLLVLVLGLHRFGRLGADPPRPPAHPPNPAT